MKIKTAILGYGRSGSTLHADPLEKLSDAFDVSAVCDTDPQACEKAKARFNCTLYTDYKEMLRQEKLDLIVIVTRSDQHCEMTCDSLHAGVNVLVTKPWCLNVAEAERMIAAEKASGRKLLPWLPARWGCDLRRLQQLVASGIIGNVFMIRRREFSFAIRHDWQTRKQCGGGYLLNWGPHVIDQAMQLAGEKVVSVYGQLRQIINPGDVEDVVHTTLTTEAGTILSCEFSMAANKLPNWVVQGDGGTIFVKEKEVEIHKATFPDGADASDYGKQPELEVIRETITGDHRITIGNRYGDALEIYPAIAAAIRGEADFPVTTASALTLTQVFDAVRLSDKHNQVVTL